MLYSAVDPELEKARFEHEERMRKMDVDLRFAEMAAERERSVANG